MMKLKPVFIILAVLLSSSMIFSACSSGEPGEQDKTTQTSANTGTIETGSTVSAGEYTIGVSGGTLEVSAPESPIDGLEITVPPDSYETTKEFKVSYAPVKEHTFGDDFDPISPLISIDNGNELSVEPIEVTVPVTVPEDKFAMGFYYDKNTGTLEGLPLVKSGADSVTVATRHFSDFIISIIDMAILYADIDSGFRPGVDDWQFANRGSYLQPGGHCSGQAMTAMWYYVNKPDGPGESLFNRYDNNGWEPSSPGFWYDDSLGYRFASVVQLEDDYTGRLFNLTRNLSVLAEKTWLLFAYSILVTGEPQFVAIVDTKGHSGHAMVVYRVVNGVLHVADPNYPGATDRVIRYENGSFKPYNSGANAEAIANGQGKDYDKIFYVAKTAFVDWDRITERWMEFKTLTIGNDVFPTYTIKWVDKNGNSQVLNDGLETEESMLRVVFTSSIAGNAILNCYQNGQLVTPTPVVAGPGAAFSLKPGNNRLGFLIAGKIPDGRYKYIDFKYYNIVYKEPTKTATTSTTTTAATSEKTWKLVETVLPDLPEMPIKFSDQFGSHSMTLTITGNKIVSDVRTAGSGGTEKGASILTLTITGMPDRVALGQKVSITAAWELTVSGEPRFTSSFVELRRGDMYTTKKPIQLEQNPTGSVTFEWLPGGDQFEVTARLSVYGDQGRVKWVYRAE